MAGRGTFGKRFARRKPSTLKILQTDYQGQQLLTRPRNSGSKQTTISVRIGLIVAEKSNALGEGEAA